MNILFLTMNNFESIHEHSIYTDLIRELAKREHSVTVLSPIEKKYGVYTNVVEEGSIKSIKVRTGNLFDVGLFQKAISRAGVCRKYTKTLRRFCKNEKYDLVLYSTPPTTLAPIVKKLKRKGAYAYLMLKDIFPQNAVDLGIIRYNSFVYKYFRRGEKLLYKNADTIGCMSPANVNYIKKQDPWIDPGKVTICPNAIEVREKVVDANERSVILNKYGIPNNRILFVYGGGLGKPQGIEFLIEGIRKASIDSNYFFVIIGNGVYLKDLKKLEMEVPSSIKVLEWLPSDEYEKIVQSCDVGLVMLNHSFLIPNFPSRILLYMQAHLPILAATDCNTDVGSIAYENEFGYWCESNNSDEFFNLLSKFRDKKERQRMGSKAFEFLKDNYSVEVVASRILSRVGEL